MKSKTLRFVAHVARIGDEGIWWRNRRERDNLEDQDTEGRIILIWIFRKWDMRAWTRSRRLRLGAVVSTYECCNELSSSMKCGEFLD
jgi:hypothetical protein